MTAFSEVKEILTNKHFVIAVLGLSANNFCVGGLADWETTYLIRYAPGATTAKAGIVVGGATVFGGILGSILGAKVTERFKHFNSAEFLVPSLFTIPAAFLLLLSINVTNSFNIMIAFLFLSQIFLFTNLAPLSSVTISVIEPRYSYYYL